jgi:hypothetical protein
MKYLEVYIFHVVRAASYSGIILAQIVLLQLSGNDVFVQFNSLFTYAMFIWGAVSTFITYSILKTDNIINLTNTVKLSLSILCIIILLLGQNGNWFNFMLIILFGLVLKIDVINLKQEKKFIQADFSDFIVRGVGLHVGTIICLSFSNFSTSQCMLISLLVITLLSLRRRKTNNQFTVGKSEIFSKDRMLLLAICISMLDAPVFLLMQTKLYPNADLQVYFIALQLIAISMLPSIAASSFWQRHLKTIGRTPNFKFYVEAQKIHFKKFLPLQIVVFIILLLIFADLLPDAFMQFLDDLVYLNTLHLGVMLMVILTAFVSNLFGPIHHFTYFYYPNASIAIIYLASLLISILFAYFFAESILHGVFMYLILWRTLSVLYFYYKTRGLH